MFQRSTEKKSFELLKVIETDFDDVRDDCVIKDSNIKRSECFISKRKKNQTKD